MELQQRQKQFVESLIAEPTKFKLYAYGCLAAHVRASTQYPLCNDADCLLWLLHSDEHLVDQVLQGLVTSEVSALAAWLSTEQGGNNFYNSCIIFSRLGSMARGITLEEKLRFLRASLAAAEKDGTLNDKIVHNQFRLMNYSNDAHEKDQVSSAQSMH